MDSTPIRKPLPNIKVFCDFDGTITIRDLGNEIIKTFGDFSLHSSLVDGTLSIHEYWQQAFATCHDLTAEASKAFALGQPADTHFLKFYTLLKENNIPLYVVSDGFDAYIRPVLESLGVSLPVSCNHLEFSHTHQAPTPQFPHASESCACTFAASCKRNTVLRYTGDDEVVVYIGDGRSDFCGAEHADIVFAKKQLAAYCNKQRIPHYPFKSFFDIATTFRKILDSGKVKQRYQAALARKKAFEAE